VIPPPPEKRDVSQSSASSSTSPESRPKETVVSAERLALLAAAERERVLKNVPSHKPRRAALILMILALLGFAVFATLAAPEPPAKLGAPSDSRNVVLALASSIDAAAAPTGLASAVWAENVWPTGVVSAFAASTAGVASQDVIVEGSTAKIKTATWEGSLSFDKGSLSVAFPSGESFCVELASTPKAPSETRDKGC
jgi:hypothetical protein